MKNGLPDDQGLEVLSLRDLAIAAYTLPRYRLAVGPFIEPRRLATFGYGFFDCVVRPDRSVDLGEEKLQLEEGAAVHAGERMIVF
jgi:hypothetical protein